MDLLGQMTTFVRIVDSGSLSAAARHLRLSTGAVSRQLSDLEQQLGGTLAMRTTRRLVVTDLGRRYYEHAVRILRDVEEAQATVRGAREVRGRLAVSTPVTYGLTRICPLVPGLLKSHPELQLDLRLEDRVVDLVAEALDVVIHIGATPPDSGSIIAHALGHYGRHAVASPEYLRRRGSPKEPDALARHLALLHVPSGGAPSAWCFRRDEREVRVEPRAALRTNVVFALREAALAGLGVAILPEWLVAGEVAAGRLCRLLPDWTADEVTVFALHRTDLLGVPRIRAFLDHLRAGLPAAARAARGS